MVRALAWVSAVVAIGCASGAGPSNEPADAGGAGEQYAGGGGGAASSQSAGAAGARFGGGAPASAAGASGAGGGAPAGAAGTAPLCSSTGHTIHEEELDPDALERGWTNNAADFACDILAGGIYAFGDGAVCQGAEGNPCGPEGCCADWRLSAGEGWGCGVVFEVTNIAHDIGYKQPLGTTMGGVRLAIEGDVPPDGYWVGFTQASSIDFASFEPARSAPGFLVPGPGEYDVFLPGRGGGGECTASCEGAGAPCESPTSEPYDIVVYARGGSTTATGRLCIRSLRIIDLGPIGCE